MKSPISILYVQAIRIQNKNQKKAGSASDLHAACRRSPCAAHLTAVPTVQATKEIRRIWDRKGNENEKKTAERKSHSHTQNAGCQSQCCQTDALC